MIKVSVVVLLVLAVLVILCGPIALIWSLNTLFPSVAIPYTMETWIAAFLIPALFKTTVTYKGKQ